MALRVVFAEDNYLVREGTAALLATSADIELVASASDAHGVLREVAKGGSVLDPKVVERLVARRQRVARSPLGQLTEREREVLEQMAQGKNNAAIARSLFLTERAIEKHINSLFHKLDLTEETDV